MACKLCQGNLPLVKAHIIPRSFYRDMLEEGPALGVSNKLHYTKRSPVGVYDSTLVCAACESSFGLWDDYAADLLLNRFDADFRMQKCGGHPIFVCDEYDYALLKMFFLSVLWRASLSTQNFFRKVSAGSTHEEILADMIRSASPGDESEYSVVLFKFVDKFGSGTMVEPCRYRTPGGVNFYVFHMGGFAAMIKVDSQAMDERFTIAMLKQDQPLLIGAEDFTKTKLFGFAIDVFSSHLKERDQHE